LSALIEADGSGERARLSARNACFVVVRRCDRDRYGIQSGDPADAPTVGPCLHPTQSRKELHAMIKLSILMVRRPDTTYEAFLHHWATTHAETIAAQPAAKRYIRRYVQDHLAADGITSGAAAFDGIAEVWFDSMEDAKAFFASDDYRDRIIPDEESFLDRPRCATFYSTAHTVVDTASPSRT
jgi:uncharacterized protein (TIGR02118 family)